MWGFALGQSLTFWHRNFLERNAIESDSLVGVGKWLIPSKQSRAFRIEGLNLAQLRANHKYATKPDSALVV